MRVAVYFFLGVALAWWLCVPGPSAWAQKKDDVMKGPSMEMQTKILKVQLATQKLISDFQGCQARKWDADSSRLQVQMQGLIDEAFKQANLDKKDYDLNMETFEFVKKTTAGTPPAPEVKKP